MTQAIVLITTHSVPLEHGNAGDLWHADKSATTVKDYVEKVLGERLREFLEKTPNLILPLVCGSTFLAVESFREWSDFARQ